MNRNSVKWHLVEASVTYSFTHYINLEVSRDGLCTLSFGLSQFHGHGSWLVCDVALRLIESIDQLSST